jgi:hypothetical protein
LYPTGHCSRQYSDVGGEAVRLEKFTAPIRDHVHKTAYGPLIDKAIYVMLLMRENPLRGQVGEVWPWKFQLFRPQTALA